MNRTEIKTIFNIPHFPVLTDNYRVLADLQRNDKELWQF